jgi:pyridoxal biosynthesis lyase PdxS
MVKAIRSGDNIFTYIISSGRIVGRVSREGDREIKGHAHVIRHDGKAATRRVAGLNSYLIKCQNSVHSVTKKNNEKLHSTESKIIEVIAKVQTLQNFSRLPLSQSA